MTFEEADKVVHPVTSQWHYPILIEYGFEAVTKEAIGFVRSYDYIHPISRRQIRCTTGCSSDYWEDLTVKKTKFWSDLEPYLKSLEAQ